MIRIDRVTEDERVGFEIRARNIPVLFTFSESEAAAKLEGLGVDNPAPLVTGCRQWGAVEIHEDPSPNGAGG